MVTVGVFSERASLTHQLGEFIVKKQDEALQKKSDFKVSVSGGSLIDALYESLVADESLSLECNGLNGKSTSLMKELCH